MKKILFLIIAIVSLTACDSSDDAAPDFESAITVDGIEFVPTSAKLYQDPTSDNPNRVGYSFSLERGVFGSDDYEAILFGVSHPTNWPTAPNGVYDFGLIEPGEFLIAQGFYHTESTTNMLFHSTVKVTYLENGKYRFEFNDVLAVVLNQAEPIVISGYFEGKVN
jgi:hypothetical protein